ncbi:MAG: sporulation protein YunB [Clostridiales bacterium]|nr:sporulation protein YunB [Clostridiales bacterium]
MECYEYNILKKRRKKFSKRLLPFFVFLFFLISIIFYNKVVIKNLFDISEVYLKSLATISVNNAVLDLFGVESEYNSIINVQKNDVNDIVLLELNPIKTNQINRKISLKAKELFENQSKKGVPISLGAFFGLKIFSGYGKKVNLKLVTENSTVCNFKSTFVSAGINQTRHSIFLEVNMVINIEVPFNKREIISKTEVLLCESVIVGKIPDTILSGFYH